MFRCYSDFKAMESSHAYFVFPWDDLWISFHSDSFNFIIIQSNMHKTVSMCFGLERRFHKTTKPQMRGYTMPQQGVNVFLVYGFQLENIKYCTSICPLFFKVCWIPYKWTPLNSSWNKRSELFWNFFDKSTIKLEF